MKRSKQHTRSSQGATRSANRFGAIWPFLVFATGLWLLAGFHPFATMCCIAFSIFGLLKLHTLVDYQNRNDSRVRWALVVAWFVLWPGLDPDAFFATESSHSPVFGEVVFAAAKSLLGAVLFFVVAPRFAASSADGSNELLAGYIALCGVAFMLHFGGFHLMSLWWRSRGRDARPLMNAPILSTSVSDFWSKRWNLAFRDYAHPFLFKPLARRWSPLAAVAGGYVFSGLVHELAISLPARGGYGLPTIYFLIQGIAILLERKLTKSGMRIRGGVRGWCWTFLVTVPAAYLLFHPPFVREVVVPLIT